MKSENREKSVIGVTMGDPCGIGPELILKALSSQEIMTDATYVVVGSENVLRRTAESLDISYGLNVLQNDTTSLNIDDRFTNDITLIMF